jgi:ribonuclease E
VEKTLRAAMRPDRARHDVGHISSFGLLELVRQRIGTSAISISSEPCPHCHGTGLRRNMEWQALFALRDLRSRLSKTAVENGKPSTFLYETNYELGLYLLNKKRDRLAELEGKFAMHIEITPK